MDESILNSIKKLLGIHSKDKSFDTDLVIHINTVFMVLNQLGIGPNEGFHVEDEDTEWDEYMTNEDNLDAVKTYIYLKVKMLFDPPLNSATQQAIQESIREYEWRLTNSK